MKARKWGPLSYSRSTDIDRTVVLVHHLRLRLWRFTLEVSFQTQASVDRIKELDAYCALRAEAVKVWSPHSVEWALEDLDGTREESMDFLRCIAAGLIADPWADE
jgi:hypothetical protein